MSGVGRVSGERVSTPEGGFNPTWQRHVAAYALCEPLLPDGPVLDLGCGVGHSYERLGSRETVGVDIEPAALEGQARETHVADMRALPFESGRFVSVLSVHSLEHVPNPEAVLAEAARVLGRGSEGTAIFVTPNRLTFGLPDEIIDPFHFVEFDVTQLAAVCAPSFERVDVLGIAGSDRYQRFVAGEKERLMKLLGADPLRLRRFVPRRVQQTLYDRILARERAEVDPLAAAIEVGDFELVSEGLDAVLDLVAICEGPR